MLASAVYNPQQTFGGEFVHATLAEMVSALWFSLMMNHPFLDGNKRVGLHACSLFLLVNSHRFTLTSEEATTTSLAIASSELSREVLAKIVVAKVAPI